MLPHLQPQPSLSENWGEFTVGDVELYSGTFMLPAAKALLSSSALAEATPICRQDLRPYGHPALTHSQLWRLCCTAAPVRSQPTRRVSAAVQAPSLHPSASRQELAVWTTCLPTKLATTICFNLAPATLAYLSL